MWIGYRAMFALCGYITFSNAEGRFECVAMIPLLLLLVASFVNDGASHFQYPPSLSAPYRKYDTPALAVALTEIGYGSAALTLLISGVLIFIVPSISMIGLNF